MVGACAPADSANEAPGLRSEGDLDESRPNIVFIMADDLGFADLSSYGRTDYETPELDALAAQGTRFTDAYAIAPVCTPTRVGLMTGRYPAENRTGLHEPLTGRWYDYENGLEAEPATLSKLLKQAGYDTGLFGKWHLGWRPEHQPAAHGFDVAFGPHSGAIDYISHEAENVALGHDLYLNGEEAWREGYITDHFTDEALSFVARADEPFFLSMQYTAPHWPWQAEDAEPTSHAVEWESHGGSPEIYADMVAALDEDVGRIVDLLQELGYAERTLVIFTSDNGGEVWSDMGPFRGRKMELWEGGIRVPAFARWPGVIPAGGTTGQVSTTLDWTTTMLAAAGLPIPDGIEGIDLLPNLRGEVPLRERTIFWRVHQRRRHRAVRSGDWKYLRIEPLGERDRGVAGEYLFDLASDPGEQSDLAGERPEVLDEMRRLYAEWEAHTLDPIPLPPPEPSTG
jgi:arylsulfatase A-like enzyme